MRDQRSPVLVVYREKPLSAENGITFRLCHSARYHFEQGKSPKTLEMSKCRAVVSIALTCGLALSLTLPKGPNFTLKTLYFGHEVPTKFLFRDGCDRQNIRTYSSSCSISSAFYSSSDYTSTFRFTPSFSTPFSPLVSLLSFL